MHRAIIVAAFAAALSLPAVAQEVPELEGAPAVFPPRAPPPPPLKAPAPAPKSKAKPAPVSPSPKPAQQTAKAQQEAADKLKADQAKLEQLADAQKQQQAEQQAAADKLKADQSRLDQQASAQKAEQSRLARLAASLTAREAELSARANELDAQEQRLAQLREQQGAARPAQIAEAEPNTPPPLKVGQDSADDDDAVVENDAGAATPAPGLPSRDLRRTLPARLDYDAALRQCTRAGEQAAYLRRFDSASYDGEPRVFNGEGWELRGRMRLEDRRGYVTVNTVCEVDTDGEVLHFAVLR